MTIQDSIAKSSTVEKLRAKGADLVEDVIEPAKDDLAEAAGKAKAAATSAARKVQHKAEKLTDSAVDAAERASDIGADLSDVAVRNLRKAEAGVRGFASRNPELTLAGAVLVGMGLATLLRGPIAGNNRS